MTPRLLITGATGFLGLPCVRHALAAGVEVHATARHRSNKLPEAVPFYPLDLLDDPNEEQIPHLFRTVRPSHLLHLSWLTTPGVYWTSPANTEWVRCSIQVLMSFGVSGGRRAILAGTCAEYDWSKNGVCREDSPLATIASTYSLSKNQIAYYAKQWGELDNHSTAWPRLFFLYGPREHPARLVPSVVNALLAGQPAECTAGTQQRDFLHVEDAAAALVQLALSDVTGPVNIGSGEAVTVKTVVETIADIVGRPDLLRLGAKPMPPTEPPLLVADVGRLRTEVKWAPRIGLRQGLEDTVVWWRGRNAG
jgi:nucleoside-diphosphate-sugar epimerase